MILLQMQVMLRGVFLSLNILQEFVAIAGSEALRNGESDPEKKIYPGGAFDPLGFTKQVCTISGTHSNCFI